MNAMLTDVKGSRAIRIVADLSTRLGLSLALFLFPSAVHYSHL